MTPAQIQIHTSKIGYPWVFMRKAVNRHHTDKWYASKSKPQLCGYWHTLSGMIDIAVSVEFDGTWKESLHGPSDLSDADHDTDGRRTIK